LVGITFCDGRWRHAGEWVHGATALDVVSAHARHQSQGASTFCKTSLLHLKSSSKKDLQPTYSRALPNAFSYHERAVELLFSSGGISGYEVNGPFSGRDLGALGILGISITSLRGYPNSAPKKTIPSIPKKNKKKKTKELHIRVISHDALAMTYKCSHRHGKPLLLVGKEIPVKLSCSQGHVG
jgi:hypothetical protein